MLAYLFWHRPAKQVEQASYEQALERFHRSLAHRPPSGFRGSACLRLDELPWLAPAEPASLAYEDWYLVDDWASVGVLEEAAISRGHITAHEKIAAHTGSGAGAVYRQLEGSAPPWTASTAVWVSVAAGHERPSLAALLGDGMSPERDGLWGRCLVLGPAPEYCLLAAEPPAGAAASRLPQGWVARPLERKLVWSG